MSVITKFEIDMLDVKAADAFLIHAFINHEGKEREYVVLVDAGNEGDGIKILNHINKYYSQKYIDLAICTHCDSDHYGGFKELLEEHKKATSAFMISKFWVHDPYQHVDVDDVKYIHKNQTLKDRLNAAYAFNDGSNLLEKIDEAKITREEPEILDSKVESLNQKRYELDETNRLWKMFFWYSIFHILYKVS